MRLLVVLASVAAIVVGASGCSDKKKPPVRPVEGSTSLMDAEALDLETIIGLVQANKVSNAKELEEIVNSDNGINNVDLDNDGQIDYILVTEARDGEDSILNLEAVPSSKGAKEDAVVVGTVRIGPSKASGDQVAVRAGYPDYVRGHDSHYYHYSSPRHGMSIGQGLFLAWALNRTRPLYYAPMPMRWAPRPIYSSSVRQTRRTTYRQQTKVSPVKKQARPSTFKPKGSAKTAQKVKASRPKSKPTGSKLSDRKGAAKSFSKDTKSKSAATGFGAKSKSAGTRSATRPTSKTGTTSKSASTSKKSGWGSGSGSRKPSTGSSRSGSSSGRSNWGSSSGSRSSGSRSSGSSGRRSGGRRRR